MSFAASKSAIKKRALSIPKENKEPEPKELTEEEQKEVNLLTKMVFSIENRASTIELNQDRLRPLIKIFTNVEDYKTSANDLAELNTLLNGKNNEFEEGITAEDERGTKEMEELLLKTPKETPLGMLNASYHTLR